MQDVSQFLETAQEILVAFAFNLVAAVVIYFVGSWVAKLVRGIVKRLMARREVNVTLVNFASTVVYYGVLAFVVIAALNRLGLQTASFVAVLGAAGLAIGLAFQGSLANFAAGVLMIVFRYFEVGQFIEAGGTMGTVEDIQLFTTRLATPDNRVVYVPNATILSGNITNFSVKETRRVDLVFGVGYEDDVDRAKQILLEEIEQETRILKDPAPTVGLVELADSSVNFAVRPWVRSADYLDVMFDFQANVKKRLDAEGLNIPFPQRDVHIFQNN
ncbi:mechanosensitive ion channel protein [filamentous cyanobacterium CCP5]|nr:mechanosensitive ion channel protein [filamentous cyanobacterium CCP5]